MKWISVKDSLPKDKQVIDIWVKGIDAMKNPYSHRITAVTYGAFSSHVTHWMIMDEPE